MRVSIPRPTRAVPLCTAALLTTSALALEPSDTSRILDEEMNRSQVMMLGHELMDRIGARLTNSPRMRQAERWAIDKLEAWGLANVRREGFEFGRGWELVSSSVVMVEPRRLALTAIPLAWTPATDGVVRAEIVVAPMSEASHFEAYRGQLGGKIVLVSLPGTGDEPTDPAFSRLSAEDIRKLDEYEQPTFSEKPSPWEKRREFAKKRDAFLASEGALLWVQISYRDWKLLHGQGYSYESDETAKLPGIEIAAEDYRRLARLAKTGPAPVLEVNSDVRFHDEDVNAYNILAEIPGTDPKAGYVMAGAHFDSWAAGDGAVDNGAGSIVVMEAARILKELGIRPKRTIRFALWAGEEQGLLGSLAYTEKHLAKRPPEGDDQPARWQKRFPVTELPGYDDLKAYFNIDNGSGKVRGIYAEGNYEAVPLLKKWLSPFASMDAGAVVASNTGGTDHVFMQAVGVPAFQFIQDPLDYGSRLHHTDIDTLDHVRPEDLRQAVTVLAGVLLAASNDADTIPPRPLPEQPLPTDPFAYDYPER